MILIILEFIGIILVLSFIQFAGLRVYLSLSKKIPEPVTSSGQLTIGIAWLFMAAFVVAVAVVGIKSVDYIELPVNRAIGIIPVVFGFIGSILLHKNEWRAFSKKYQRNKS